MTTATDLSPEAKRRILVEWAVGFNAEANASERPVSEMVGAFVPQLAPHLSPLTAVQLFTEFAAERAVASTLAGYDVLEQAEQRAEKLLDELVGEGS